MIIFNMEEASASPYIMLFPLDIHNMCIEMQCFIITLLETQDKISFDNASAFGRLQRNGLLADSLPDIHPLIFFSPISDKPHPDFLEQQCREDITLERNYKLK